MTWDSPRVLHVDTCQSAADCVPLFLAYPKLSSWLLLHVAGVPALEGIVIRAWDDTTYAEIQRFANRFGSDSLLLRSDSSAETGQAPRGGFLVHGRQIEQTTRELLEQDRVVFLLEPASPFDDLYSVTLEPDHAWQQWLLEVVGAGFDASDLKRGDITPHERIEAVTDNGDRWRIITRVPAAAAVVEAGRVLRCAKVAAMLECSVVEVADLLRRRGEPLLANARSYKPIPEALVMDALGYAKELRPVLITHGYGDHRVSISWSVLAKEHRLVFWDVVWPQVKYGTHDYGQRGPEDG
jgi:hypothetical protein